MTAISDLRPGDAITTSTPPRCCGHNIRIVCDVGDDTVWECRNCDCQIYTDDRGVVTAPCSPCDIHSGPERREAG